MHIHITVAQPAVLVSFKLLGPLPVCLCWGLLNRSKTRMRLTGDTADIHEVQDVYKEAKRLIPVNYH